MEDAAALDEVAAQVCGSELGVGTGLAREREGAVAVLVEGDEGERGEEVGIGDEAGAVDARVKATSWPRRLRATSTLAGAPPGLRSNSF